MAEAFEDAAFKLAEGEISDVGIFFTVIKTIEGDYISLPSNVFIQKMVKKMDAGDLVVSSLLDIGNEENGGLLYTRLKYQAALSLNELIQKIDTGKLVYTPQDEENISFAPTLKKVDGFLNFKEETFEEIKNKIDRQ